MKSFPRLTMLLFAIAGAELSHAAAVTGTVRSVSGDVATVATSGDLVPPTGTRAEFLFKMAGFDEEISVATGSVLRSEHGDLLVKIENATGNVDSGQLVRFSSSPSAASTTSSPAPTPPATIEASPELSPTPAANSSIPGAWTGNEHNGDTVSFVFGTDEKVRYIRIVKNKKKHVVSAKYRAKYRTDCGSTPCRIEVFDFEINDTVPKGETLSGVFQVQEFGFNERALKLDLSISSRSHPEKGLTENALTLIREKPDTPPPTPSSNDPN
ncbi:MAG: hypothetical protein QOD12_1110 [Verrucomicrobiota bacterium]|jgi:hypothetical protein